MIEHTAIAVLAVMLVMVVLWAVLERTDAVGYRDIANDLLDIDGEKWKIVRDSMRVTVRGVPDWRTPAELPRLGQCVVSKRAGGKYSVYRWNKGSQFAANVVGWFPIPEDETND